MYGATLFRSRLSRFLFIGAVTTVLCYVVYAVLLAAGVHYTVANLAAVAAGMVFSFKTQGTFVFDNTDNRRIGRFLLSRLVIYIANVLFIKRMLMFGLDEYVSGAIAMPAIAMLSYALQRFFVFHKRETTEL
jgi:putative flippase GtrA